jgi:hypothetical protein
MKLSPKFLSAILCAVVLLVLSVGCSTTGSNPLLTPSALRAEVGAGVRIGLDLYPNATPEVSLARDVICAEVAKTNLDPAVIVRDLEKLGLTNQHTKLIIDGGILAYNTVFSLVSTNALSSVQPYLDALCAGFSDALPAAGLAARANRKALPPHLR